MSDTVIKVENLSKQYRLGIVGTGTLSHDLNRWWCRMRGKPDPYLKIDQQPVAPSSKLQASPSSLATPRSALPASQYVWALKDINFEVKRGEILGIIGRNGAGKSTLLKIISRVTAPTEGRAKMKGRIASLLEVGTGFHPELTGRENIFLNGAILGMTKAEICRKLDEIIDFAEVEKYIDTPVKRYSSGMYVRLAFAVAAHLEPDILVVDEVLAVGDAAFQKKCLGKMNEVSVREGRTVLFVSHNMGAVASLCFRGFWLDGGAIRSMGEARSVIDQYLGQKGPDHNRILNLTTLPRPFSTDSRLHLESLEWLCDVPLRHGQPVKAIIQFRTSGPLDDVTVGIGFSTIEGTRMLTYETDFQDGSRPSLSEARTYSAQVEIDYLPLAPGNYALDVGCRSGDSYGLDYLPAAAQLDVIPGPKTPGYIVRKDAGVRLPSSWSWVR